MKSPNLLTNYICNLTLLCSFFLSLLTLYQLPAQQLAFPAAKGAGAYASGGRGGQVIHVTTLDWNAPGGLREAIRTPGPRIIVFDVSGEIDATSEGNYTPIISGSDYDNITIAGQSAPEGGITIRTSEFMFNNVDNVVLRYIRFRGDIGSYQDAFWFTGGNNIIIDHCTFSHGGDEAASMASSTGIMGNVTMQNCFFQDSKTGSIIGVDDVDGDFTFVNNAYCNVSHRFPNPKGEGHYDIINNIIYNWKYRLIRVTGSGTYNVMNNYYKASLNGLRQPGWFGDGNISWLQKLQTQANDNPLIYSSGSIVVGQRETPLLDDSDMWTVFAGSHLPENSQAPLQYFTDTPFSLVGNGFEVKAANQAYIDVLNDVGADKTLNADGSIYAYRDTKDTADILMMQNDTYNGTFYDARTSIEYPTIPQNVRPVNFDSNNDGMPDAWKISRGFAINDDLSSYVWSSGYIGVEEYLNEIDLNSIDLVDVTGVEVTPETTSVNIPNTLSLTAKVLPINATNQNGVWSSSDNNIATVNSAGIVQPVAEGQVTITFTTNDGGFTDEALVTVTNIIIPLESVAITPENVTLDLGESLQLATAFLPENTSDTSGVWASSDESIVLVDDNGYITAINEGQAEISFIANDGGLTDSSIVTVIDTFFGTYFLYNAVTDQLIQPIEGDETINLVNGENQINFRSIPEGGDDNISVESVEVSWTGQANGYWLESSPIYAGMSNHNDLDFEPYLVEEGTYNFTVTYYSEDSAIGDIVAVDTFSLTFFFDTTPTANAGLDEIICLGETVTLTASGGPNFLWNTGETTASIEVSPNETTTYTVTVSNNEGEEDSDDVIVNVNPIPVANAGEDQTICEGESTTLIASGGDSYIWSTGETTASIEVNPNLETTYDVEVISNNCSSTDTVTVFVNDAPDITVTDNIVIVEGDSATLTASGSDNYQWSTGETTESISVNPTITTVYTVSSIGNNGCSSDAEVIVTVVPEVIANAGEDVTICNGETVILNASGGVTYAWNTGDNGSELIVSPTVTTTYTVTVEDDFGFSDTDSVTVTVNEVPNVTVDDDVWIMVGTSATLTANGGDSYIWSTGETTASILVNPIDTTTYTVTGFSVNGCESTAEVVVNVVEELNANAGEDVTICFGESVTLNASGGITYTWNTGDTGSSPTFSPTETTTYTVTVTDVLGNSDSDDVMIIVNSLPTANAGEDQTVCEGESVVLTASGGDAYLWSTGETSNTITVSPNTDITYTVEVFSNNCSDTDEVTVFVIPGPDITVSNDITIVMGNSTTLVASGAETYLWNTGESTSDISVNPSETTTYTVIGTSNSCSAEAQVTVTVVPLFEASAGEDERVCDSDSYEIVLSANQGDSYLWNTGETTQNIVVSPLSTSTYTVTVILGQQEDTDSVTVYVDPSPDVVIANGDSVDVLSGDFVTLSASGANTYEWNNGATQPNIAVSPSATTTYEVRGYVGDCYDDKQVTVNVFQPVVADAGEDVYICLDEVATLTATGGDEYLWNTGETTQTIEVSPTVTTDYTVTVFNALDFDEASVTVEVANCSFTEPTEPGDDLLEFNFDIFPNPARNYVKVKLSGALLVSDIYIYDLAGKLVQKNEISNEDLSPTTTTQINISSLQNGMYFVKLVDEDREITKKLIVK